MNIIERHKLKKKAKLLFTLAYLVGLGLTALSVLFFVFVIKPIEEPTILHGILFLLPILTPLFSGLGLTMFGSIELEKLRRERKRLYKEKSELYYHRFINLVRFKQFEEARNYYNDFITAPYRIISHGILLGAVLHSDADKDWRITALDRMLSM